MKHLKKFNEEVEIYRGPYSELDEESKKSNPSIWVIKKASHNSKTMEKGKHAFGEWLYCAFDNLADAEEWVKKHSQSQKNNPYLDPEFSKSELESNIQIIEIPMYDKRALDNKNFLYKSK